MSKRDVQLVQEMALARAQRTWSETSEAEKPTCPVCDLLLQDRGEYQRTRQGKGGRESTVKRHNRTCPCGGTGLFPLDEEVGLLPGRLTPT
jgi:hypothetical protein